MRNLILSVTLILVVPGRESQNLSSPHPIPIGECQDIQNDFIDGYNSMSTCFIKYAPTGDYCKECKPNLNFLKETYRQMRKTYQDPSNVTCFDVLCRQNSIGVVCSDYKYIHHIWDDSKCNYCYMNNSATSDFLKPDVVVYISLVKNVTDCFAREDDVCTNCQDSYRQLSRMFFHEWYASSIDGSYQCRDIYDKYNVTMREWNEVYGCVRESGESFLLPFIVLFSYIVLLFFSFYFLVIFILPKQKWLNLVEISSRTEVLPIDIPIRELRSEESYQDLCKEMSFEEIQRETSCPCFRKFTQFVQEYRDARENFRREDPPDTRVIAAIHRKYSSKIHNSRNFQLR